jgi:hypothetical protein
MEEAKKTELCVSSSTSVKKQQPLGQQVWKLDDINPGMVMDALSKDGYFIVEFSSHVTQLNMNVFRLFDEFVAQPEEIKSKETIVSVWPYSRTDLCFVQLPAKGHSR